jgi:hypothetical protein
MENKDRQILRVWAEVQLMLSPDLKRILQPPPGVEEEGFKLLRRGREFMTKNIQELKREESHEAGRVFQNRRSRNA